MADFRKENERRESTAFVHIVVWGYGVQFDATSYKTVRKGQYKLWNESRGHPQRVWWAACRRLILDHHVESAYVRENRRKDHVIGKGPLPECGDAVSRQCPESLR